MDAQSPSKRFIKGIPLHVENNIVHRSLLLGLTQEFGEISGSLSKPTTMQEIRSKFNNDPSRFVDGGVKNPVDVVTGSSKKRKHKADVYTVHNDQNEALVLVNR
ncbi:hypothetical protein EJD97_011878, partial [Solanum chilense]